MSRTIIKADRYSAPKWREKVCLLCSLSPMMALHLYASSAYVMHWVYMLWPHVTPMHYSGQRPTASGPGTNKETKGWILRESHQLSMLLCQRESIHDFCLAFVFPYSIEEIKDYWLPSLSLLPLFLGLSSGQVPEDCGLMWPVNLPFGISWYLSLKKIWQVSKTVLAMFNLLFFLCQHDILQDKTLFSSMCNVDYWA